MQFGSIQLLNSLLRVLRIGHFDEREATRLTGVPIPVTMRRTPRAMSWATMPGSRSRSPSAERDSIVSWMPNCVRT